MYIVHTELPLLLKDCNLAAQEFDGFLTGQSATQILDQVERTLVSLRSSLGGCRSPYHNAWF